MGNEDIKNLRDQRDAVAKQMEKDLNRKPTQPELYQNQEWKNLEDQIQALAAGRSTF